MFQGFKCRDTVLYNGEECQIRGVTYGHWQNKDYGRSYQLKSETGVWDNVPKTEIHRIESTILSPNVMLVVANG